MKQIFTVLLALSISTFTFAQEQEIPDTEWKVGGQIGLTLTEASFHNWAQGGENSLSGISFLQLYANKTTNGWVWENTLDFEYGLMQIQDGILKKTNDRIELNSKIGKHFINKWYYSGFLNFKTQVAEGYDYGTSTTNYISKFMAPAYLNVGLGMDYKPDEHFSALIAPFASKTTFVLDDKLADAGSFGVEAAKMEDGKLVAGKKIRQEIGATVTLSYKKDIFENINLNTKLTLFSNYLDNPQNVDVDWQTTITMKVNKYINAVFKAHLIYDDDIDVAWTENGVPHLGPKTQFNQSLSVGLMYKF